MESRRAARGDRYDPPSFSSTLLDSIYRSFDESGHEIRPPSRSRSQSQPRRGDGMEEVLFREMIRKSQCSACNGGNSTDARMMKKTSSVSMDRRSRAGDADGHRPQFGDRRRQNTATIDDDLVLRQKSSAMASERRRSLQSMKLSSLSSSSSDSSTSGGFSSSDADSLYAANKKKSLKPIRTSISDVRSDTFRSHTQFENSISDKRDSAGKTAKSRAMKLYGDLKRMKQPISPGGKLANFLNSLFSSSGASKKQRTSSSSCSTASSYSRSCLSKTPLSAGQHDGIKRTVRFSPVSVIVDKEIPREASSSKATSSKPIDKERKLPEKNRRVELEEMARDLLRNYQRRTELAARKGKINGGIEEMEIYRDQNKDDHKDDDDDESCCSSDLFELEIGVDRYCEELPVYETTHVDTNRAIASGFSVRR